MKQMSAFVSCTAALCCLPLAQGMGESQFAGALFDLFRKSFVGSDSKSKGLSGSRFMEKASEASEAENDDDLKAQFEILNTDRLDRLLLMAKHKRSVAKEIMAAGERAKAEIANIDEKNQNEAAAQAEYDFNRAAVLEKQAELLESEAKHVKNMMESYKIDSSVTNENPETNCDILKLGPLKFIPESNEILDFKNDDTMGQITGSAFTIHYKKQLKSTFFWQGIELPVKSVEDSPNCLAFKYRGNEQILCAPSKIAKDSWIDALSEAWFCRNMGIKGILPSVKNAKKEMKKQKGFLVPPPKPKQKEKRKALVNVDIAMDDKKKVHVKVNGKERSIGEHVKVSAAHPPPVQGIMEKGKNAVKAIEEKAKNLLKKEKDEEEEKEEEDNEEEEEED